MNLSLREVLSLPFQIDTPSTNLNTTTNICYGDWSGLYKAAHTLTGSQIAQTLGVDPQDGLSNVEVESRLQQNESNKVEGAERLSLWKIQLRQVSK